MLVIGSKEGTTESQDAAWGEETDKSHDHALSATEDEFSSKLKTWWSNLLERFL